MDNMQTCVLKKKSAIFQALKKCPGSVHAFGLHLEQELRRMSNNLLKVLIDSLEFPIVELA